MAPLLIFFTALLAYVLWLLVGLNWPGVFFRKAERIKIRLKLRVLFWVLIASIGTVLSATYAGGEAADLFASFLIGVAAAWVMAFGTFLCIEYMLEAEK
jgi:hypothetical protein